MGVLDTPAAPLLAPPPSYAARFSYAGTGVVAAGDSLTANFGNNLTQIGDSPSGYALALSGGRSTFRGSTATGGFTLAQIRDTHIPVVTAMTPKPAACVVLGGTNDTGSNTTPFVLADALATLTQIYTLLEAAGIRPIACTIPPRSDSTAVNALVDKWNRAVKRLAAARGYALADYHKTLVDPVTGGWKTGLGQTDKIHASYAGTKAMGAALSAALVSSLPFTSPPVAEHLVDSTDLLAGAGLFRTDVSATSNNIAGDGIADGWRSFGSSANTYALETDPDGTMWQAITEPSTGGPANLQRSAAAVCAPGDVLEICARIQTTGFDAALIAPTASGSGGTGPAWSLLLEAQRASNTSSYVAVSLPAYLWHCDVPDGVVYGRAAVGADATGTVRVSMTTTGVPATGSVKIRYANLAVRNLTALGLA